MAMPPPPARRLRRILAAVILLFLMVAATAVQADLLYTPNGQGKEIVPPTLSRVGPTLLVSNSPEILPAARPVALYRDRVAHGFRIFIHHVNKADRLVRVALAFTNTGPTPCDLVLSSVGFRLPLLADGDPAMAGERVYALWLQARSETGVTVSIAPGASHFVEAEVPCGATLTGMMDGDARTAEGADVTVTVLAYDSKPEDPLAVPVVPLGMPPRRGTFPHADRSGTVEFDGSELSFLDIGSPPFGRWSRHMEGEYEPGVDATSGRSAMNDGNYGVAYRLKVVVGPQPTASRLVLNAAGGLSRFALAVDGRIYAYPGPIPAYQGWPFLRLDPGGGSFDLQVTIPGGSNGAARLYCMPDGSEPALKAQKGKEPGGQ